MIQQKLNVLTLHSPSVFSSGRVWPPNHRCEISWTRPYSEKPVRIPHTMTASHQVLNPADQNALSEHRTWSLAYCIRITCWHVCYQAGNQLPGNEWLQELVDKWGAWLLEHFQQKLCQLSWLGLGWVPRETWSPSGVHTVAKGANYKEPTLD